MADSDEEGSERVQEVAPMPENRVIFTDFSDALVEKAIRRK